MLTRAAHAPIGLRLAAWALLAGGLFSLRPHGWASALDVSGALREHHTTPYAALLIFAVGLALARRELWARMQAPTAPRWVLAGAVLLAAAALARISPAHESGALLAMAVGAFAAIFGRAARLPLAFLAVWVVAVGFQSLVEAVADAPYATASSAPGLLLLRAIGASINMQGQFVTFSTAGGEPIEVLINASCAGPATIGLLLMLFAVMRADVPLSRRLTAQLLLIGLAATFAQNVLRLALLLASGYFFGENALWDGHYALALVWFPLWYLAFAAYYLRSAARERASAPPLPA